MDKTPAQIIEDAFDPDECEACEIHEYTCWECAEDALEDAGFAPLW